MESKSTFYADPGKLTWDTSRLSDHPTIAGRCLELLSAPMFHDSVSRHLLFCTFTYNLGFPAIFVDPQESELNGILLL